MSEQLKVISNTVSQVVMEAPVLIATVMNKEPTTDQNQLSEDQELKAREELRQLEEKRIQDERKRDQKKSAKTLQMNLLNDVATIKTQMTDCIQKFEDFDKMTSAIEQLQKRIVTLSIQVKLASGTKPKPIDE